MSWSLIHADVLEGLASLRDGSAHAAVTSPPYWGLRDYHGVPETDWPSGWRGKLGLEPRMSDLYHHRRCPKAQAWDVGGVRCRCPRGWPRTLDQLDPLDQAKAVTRKLEDERDAVVDRLARDATERIGS